MGDSLIVRRGGSGSSQYKLKTEIIQTNKTWTVPKAKDQVFSIRIFGGGATTPIYYTNGGGGGYMNNKIFALLEGEKIPITIGAGGYNGHTGNAGGTTSFGTYLAANGGYEGNGGSGGGHGSFVNVKNGTIKYSIGANGYQFGGGGGGGYGGYWGGGGGTTLLRYGGWWNNSGTWERSGLGGNGGNITVAAEDGVNTIGNPEVPNGSNTKFGYELNLQGEGKGGGYIGGGGGYGGNGGNTYGGGGGYGGNGGSGSIYNVAYSGKTYTIFSGGGGGGYGSLGGNGYNKEADESSNYNLSYAYGGGGGGYGKSGYGGDGYGGPYIQNGGIAAGAGSAGSMFHTSGGNGICIIQYYA